MASTASERKLRQFKERPLRPGAPGAERPKGRLLIVGGREDKEDEKVILRELARLVGDGKLVVTTLASGSPDESMEQYEKVLRGLGVKHIHHLRIEERAEAETVRAMNILEDATAVYFTGGDQLKITSLIGDTPVYSRIYEIFLEGGTIAGTSAGAAVMSETMIVGGGANGGSYRIGDALQLAPGLGFAKDIVVDQHFAERGRMGRLLAVVAQNPRILGIGIDEDTAIEVQPNRGFRVLGDGGVYVVDGREVEYSNVAEEDRDRTLSVFGVKVHLLSQGDTFDLNTRTPDPNPAEIVEQELEEHEAQAKRSSGRRKAEAAADA